MEISSEEEDVTGGEGRPSKRRRTIEAAKGLADMVEGPLPWVFPADIGFCDRHRMFLWLLNLHMSLTIHKMALLQYLVVVHALRGAPGFEGFHKVCRI